MKKILLLTAAMVATSGVFAKKVAFVVDMTGQTVSPNGVHVAGSFQGWDPSTSVLLPIPGLPNFYGNVFDINAKQVIEFKAINGGANSNDWGGAESVPALCQKGHVNNGQTNDNRWMYIDSLKNDTTTITLKFASAAPTGKIALRFAVDLAKEASVNANGVYIAGNFQDDNGASGEWKPNETRMTNLYSDKNKIFEYIAYVGNTEAVEYKYLNGNDWPQNESVPSGCQVGGGNSNRFFNAASVSTALDKVCFGSCSACPSAPIPTFSYMFQVDMSNSDCEGGFDSVTVAGAGAKLTGFGAGLKMNKVGTTNIYALTVADLDSGELNFKYRYHKNGNTKWEGGDNRISPLTKNDTAKITCFGLRVEGNCAPKPKPSKITFVADFTKRIAPPASKIYLIGDFTTPQWQPGAREMKQVPGKLGVYYVTIDSICPGKIAYKFTNGDATNVDNEEKFKEDSLSRGCVEPNGQGGFNRAYTRLSDTAVTLSFFFDSCTVGFIPVLSVSEEISANNFKLYPNPTNEFSVLAFNDNAKAHQVAVIDIAGKVVRNYNCETPSLRIDRNELKAGVYFVNITNERNQSVTIKLLIQE